MADKQDGKDNSNKLGIWFKPGVHHLRPSRRNRQAIAKEQHLRSTQVGINPINAT